MNSTLIGSANVDVTQNVFVATGIDIPTDYDWLLVEIAYGDRNKEYFTALVNYSDLNGLTVGKPDKPLARTAHLDIGEVAGSRVYLGKAYDNGFLLCVGGSGIDTLPLRVYGLEKASAEVGFLGPDADVNSLTDPGVYMRLSNSWSGSNNPFGTGGFVLYVSSEEGTAGQSNGHVRQTIRSFRQNQVYFVRETPDGDGTSTAVPSTITTGWLERDNYASYPEADVSNTIRVEAQQDVPSAVERDDLRASYGTSGTGGNAHYADSHPVRPLRESHWYPANYGVPADRNKVLQIYGTFGLHGKTISKLLIGKAGSVSEYDVTTTVSSAEGTTQIETTAGIPNLVSGGNTEIYYNLKFTDGSYLYSRVRAGSKTPVTLSREKMREWLGVSSVFEDETGTNGVEWRYSKSLSLASSPARLQLEIHTSSDSDAPLPADRFTNNMKGYVSYVELSAAGRQVVHFSTSATGSNRHDRSQTVKASVLSNLYLGVRNDTTGDVISIGPVKRGSDRYIWNADAGKVAGFLSGAKSGANDWTFVLFDVSKRDRDNPLGESVTRSERDKLLEVEKGAQRNVKSDWNAASGDAQILNKPMLGSASAKDVATASTDIGNSTSEKLIPGKLFGTAAKSDIAGGTGTQNDSKLPTVKQMRDYVTTNRGTLPYTFSKTPVAGQVPIVGDGGDLDSSIIPSSAIGIRITNLEFMVFESAGSRTWSFTPDHVLLLLNVSIDGGNDLSVGTATRHRPSVSYRSRSRSVSVTWPGRCYTVLVAWSSG